jgi:methyl-accepting chemotaxis protein
MISSWTFGRKVGMGFALAGAVLLLVAGFGYSSTHTLVENDRLVSHTHQVRREIASLMSVVTDAETNERGFVLTNEQAYNLAFQAAAQRVPAVVDGLITLTNDNPRQQARLATIKPALAARLATMWEVIARRIDGGMDAAAKLVVAGQGKRQMDEFRRIGAEMDTDESALLERRMREAEDSANLAKAVILWGSLVGLVLIVLAGAFISSTLSRQIAMAVRHIQSSAAELQAAASQQATGAREQATATTEIITTISELMATSRQIAESAQRVAAIAEQTATAARSGDGTVDRGQESVSGVRKQVDVIVSHMLDLGKKSQQIGSVLDIVSELAEQTNILAINATIEAAGAGDSGKRFSVVADEIRKLADRVGGSTKEIRGLIDDVRSAVNTSVMTTETGSKAVDAGSRQFAEVATAFREISGQVGTTTEAAKEIELSTKQQASAVEQVNVAMNSVAQSTREAEVSTAQTLRTASELARLSRDLMRLVQPDSAAVARQPEA